MQVLRDNQASDVCQVGEIECCIWSKDSSPYLDPSISLSQPVDLPISTGRSPDLGRRSPELDRSIPGLARRSLGGDLSILGLTRRSLDWSSHTSLLWCLED